MTIRQSPAVTVNLIGCRAKRMSFANTVNMWSSDVHRTRHGMNNITVYKYIISVSQNLANMAVAFDDE
jgi:hypothetical protein